MMLSVGAYATVNYALAGCKPLVQRLFIEYDQNHGKRKISNFGC